MDCKELAASECAILKLAAKLCSKNEKSALQACNILNIYWFMCLDSSNLEEFITRAHFMLKTKSNYPKLSREYGEAASDEDSRLYTLVIKMTHTLPQIIKRLRPSLTPYPVCAWEKIFCTLFAVDETTLSTKEPVSHWILDL